jgi:hypothetical protein
MEVELFHADCRIGRRTDMTKLRQPLRNFSNAPKNAGHNVKQMNTIYKQT